MDTRKNFTQAWESMLKHKSIGIIIFLNTLLMVGVIALVLNATGFSTIVEYSNQVESNFREEQISQNLTHSQMEELPAYKAEQQKISEMWRAAFNTETFIVLIPLGIVMFIISFYINSTLFVLISNAAMGKKSKAKDVMNNGWKYFWTVIWVQILLNLIIIVPILLAIILVILGFLINNILGIILLIICINTCVAYLFVIIIRLAFAVPIIFTESKNVKESIKQSYKMTEGKAKPVVVMYLVMFAILVPLSLAGSSLGFDPVSSTALNVLNLCLMLVYYAINSFATALAYLFLFHSYLDFRGKSPKPGVKNNGTKRRK